MSQMSVVYEHRERNSKYFFGLQKRNKRKSSIYKLLINDREIINQKEILQFIMNFFQEKYSRKIQVTEKECEDFLSAAQVSSLTAEDKRQNHVRVNCLNRCSSPSIICQGIKHQNFIFLFLM